MPKTLLSEQDYYLWEQLSTHITQLAGTVSETFSDNIYRLAITSSYALEQLVKHPQWLQDLDSIEQFKLEKSSLELAAEEPLDIARYKDSMRLYRHRKLVDIIFLDSVRACNLEQTLENLSNLADFLLASALEISQRVLAAKHGEPLDQQGNPMQLNLLAMGKLGGGELNFSSDVDLICCYANDGELNGFGHLPYQEYFTRVVRLWSQILSETTAQGFVYRVDLRLRPWGESGPVVLSHAAIEHYYQLHGREWEQYAMVKARILTGSTADVQFLNDMIRPFVYRKYHDYRVFEGLASLKDKIDVQARKLVMKDNIKLGPGGIREIEFFVQAFQILKGGRNLQLQNPSLLHSLNVLQQQSIIPHDSVKTMRQGYYFLRQLENRIQMLYDQQAHSIPDNQNDRERLAYSMHFENWKVLETELERQRENIHACFNDLFKRDVEPEPSIAIGDNLGDDSNDAIATEYLLSIGLENPYPIQTQLEEFYRSKAWGYMSARAKKRFNHLLPEFLKALPGRREQNELFKRLMHLFSSIAGRSVYFELLYQQNPLLEKLVDLFSKSSWIAQQVSNYPMLLEVLISSGNLKERFDHETVTRRLKLQLDNVAGDSELELDVLRLFKLEQTIIIASAELAEEISTLDVGRYLSDLAQVLLNAVYTLSVAAMQKLYGRPCFVDQGNNRQAEMSIIGYGKLGGQELHYQSDLDVIFLHNSRGDSQHTDGKKCLDNSVYFARLAQKIISTISVMTGSGKLYEIDSRLRPEGSSGLLVSSTFAYQRYQHEKAWTWEHQALVRARHVVGSSSLNEEFQAMRSGVLSIKREPQQLRIEIRDMREKILAHKPAAPDGQVNIKYSRGCIMDIEFMVQYWVLLNANNVGSICLYSDNISLLNELARIGLISSSQSQLVDIYICYHRWLHETVLQNKPAEIEADLVATEVAHVVQCWNECMADELLEK